jgi:hypothetical protein
MKRLWAAGAVVLVCLALGGVPAGAQSPAPAAADPMAPATVTGIERSTGSMGLGTTTYDRGVTRIEGATSTGVWEASDPRLSGEVTYVGNWHRYSTAPAFQVEAASRVVVNEGGGWVGTATALAGDKVGNYDTVVLTGEGAYAGLTAYVLMDWTKDPATFVGAIFPGEMPSPPEPGGSPSASPSK